MIELFAWFRKVMEDVARQPLPERPGEILRQLRAPAELSGWAEKVVDGSFAEKITAAGKIIPDLESRQRQVKRNAGQFYTPEAFVAELRAFTAFETTKSILDPSCGDGSFLLPVAASMAEEPDCLSHIYGYDIDPQALLICLGRLLESCPRGGWPHLRCEDFLRAAIQEKFALIIGNPPYKVNLDDDLKDYLLQNYETAEGEKDLYTFFLERSAKLLQENGEMLLLTSHTWLVNHQCRLLRRFIFSHRVENLFLLPVRFFAHAPGVLPVVVHLRQLRAKETDQLVLHADYCPGRGWSKKYRAGQNIMIENSGLRQAIVPPQLKKIFEIMSRQHRPLGELCRVGVGIQESLKREGAVSKFVADNCETSRHRKVLKGRELAPMKINWEGKYIDYGPHLAYAGDAAIFSGEKILYQNIRNEKLKTRLVAACDREGYFPKNSLSFIVAQHQDLSLDYLEALLNSTLINSWFSSRYHSFHITVSQVRSIPVALPSPRLREELEQLVAAIRRASGSEAEILSWRHELDQKVCEVYAGPGDHRELVKDCDFFLEQAAAL